MRMLRGMRVGGGVALLKAWAKAARSTVQRRCISFQ